MRGGDAAPAVAIAVDASCTPIAANRSRSSTGDRRSPPLARFLVQGARPSSGDMAGHRVERLGFSAVAIARPHVDHDRSRIERVPHVVGIGEQLRGPGSRRDLRRRPLVCRRRSRADPARRRGHRRAGRTAGRSPRASTTGAPRTSRRRRRRRPPCPRRRSPHAPASVRTRRAYGSGCRPGPPVNAAPARSRSTSKNTAPGIWPAANAARPPRCRARAPTARRRPRPPRGDSRATLRRPGARSCERHDDRRVVARLALPEGGLAFLAFDHDLLQTLRDRQGAQREIDPSPHPLWNAPAW